MEAILLRPLPPFRAKPSRKALVPKRPDSRKEDGRKEDGAVAVKAARLPIRLARVSAAPSRKILTRPLDAPA